MRAAQLHEQGPGATLVVGDVDVPIPGTGQVLIRVEAAGVNFADLMIRFGAYPQPMQLPFIPGTEVVGVVTSLGPGVESINVGQRVTAAVDSGGYAEFCVADASAVAPVDATVDSAVALAMTTQGITAYQLLTEAAKVRAGEVVVVHAAAGGVGSLAVQIARQLGVRVVAVVGSESKRCVAEELGADLVVDSSASDWADQIALAVGPVDVVLDSIGGEVSAAGLGLLRPVSGRLVVYGAASGEPPAINMLDLIGQNTTITGYSMYPYIGDPAKMGGAAAALRDFVGAGTVRPITQHSFRLDECEAAHQLIASRKSIGKVVLVP